MAIIHELGLEVSVLVDGAEATEYTPDEEAEVDDDFGPSTERHHCYVESIDDAHFAVRARVTSENKIGKKWIEKSPQHAFLVDLVFDGKHSGGSIKLDKRRNPHFQDGAVDCTTKTKRKYRFASVSTVDDANKQRIAKDLKAAKNLGLIQAVVYRIIVTGRKAKTRTSYAPKIAEGGISLAEKALKGKAISHGTTFSDPIKYDASPVDVTFVDSLGSPLAVFYFKYRSKESLQQELIIPRPRSLSIEPDVDNLSPEELRRLASERLLQMRGKNKRAASIKDEDDRPSGSGRAYKFVKIEGGKKAIDLTEDD
ncbi:hypothetical protein VMCG_04360 [Cytospora schulzeri]|uniref:DUF7918 domain-containing protein n=1 Tax=Cytospora schulzeri TaxID=448051 RepID=A0A423WSC8_9PEZI|nr:hypothetical protein VMCG_04360 [Valsa malicola]